nr:hypothetical protein L203_02865 [Cryptococcus depauperatus CBS 7841]
MTSGKEREDGLTVVWSERDGIRLNRDAVRLGHLAPSEKEVDIDTAGDVEVQSATIDTSTVEEARLLAAAYGIGKGFSILISSTGAGQLQTFWMGGKPMLPYDYHLLRASLFVQRFSFFAKRFSVVRIIPVMMVGLGTCSLLSVAVVDFGGLFIL